MSRETLFLEPRKVLIVTGIQKKQVDGYDTNEYLFDVGTGVYGQVEGHDRHTLFSFEYKAGVDEGRLGEFVKKTSIILFTVAYESLKDNSLQNTYGEPLKLVVGHIQAHAAYFISFIAENLIKGNEDFADSNMSRWFEAKHEGLFQQGVFFDTYYCEHLVASETGPSALGVLEKMRKNHEMECGVESGRLRSASVSAIDETASVASRWGKTKPQGSRGGLTPDNIARMAGRQPLSVAERICTPHLDRRKNGFAESFGMTPVPMGRDMVTPDSGAGQAMARAIAAKVSDKGAPLPKPPLEDAERRSTMLPVSPQSPKSKPASAEEQHASGLSPVTPGQEADAREVKAESSSGSESNSESVPKDASAQSKSRFFGAASAASQGVEGEVVTANNVIAEINKYIKGKMEVKDRKEMIINLFTNRDYTVYEKLKKTGLDELIKLFEMLYPLHSSKNTASNTLSVIRALFVKEGLFGGGFGLTNSSQKVLHEIKVLIISRCQNSENVNQEEETIDGVHKDIILKVIDTQLASFAISRLLSGKTNSRELLDSIITAKDMRRVLDFKS